MPAGSGAQQQICLLTNFAHLLSCVQQRYLEQLSLNLRFAAHSVATIHERLPNLLDVLRQPYNELHLIVACGMPQYFSTCCCESGTLHASVPRPTSRPEFRVRLQWLGFQSEHIVERLHHDNRPFYHHWQLHRNDRHPFWRQYDHYCDRMRHRQWRFERGAQRKRSSNSRQRFAC